MPDITMCTGVNTAEEICPQRDLCYRYTAKPDPLWQSFFSEAWFRGSLCRHFMDNGAEVDKDTKRQ